MQLYNADCFDILPQLADKSVDLVVLDLPYGETRNQWDKPLDLDRLWRELKRIGKDTTPFVFFCSSRYGYSLIQANPGWYRYDLVWDKVNCTSGFLNSRIRPMRNHEMLYVFYKKPFFNIADNHTRTDNVTFSESLDSVATNWGKSKKIQSGHAGNVWSPKLPTSVLHFPSKRTHKHLHSTEKAEAILEWIIRYYSTEGGVVLDPTMGAGVTGMVAQRLDRSFIGIEQDPLMYSKAVERIPVHGGVDKTST